MRFARFAPTTLVISTIAVVSAMGLALHALVGGLISDVEDGRYQQMDAIVQAGLREAEDHALARAELIADLPRIQALVAAQDRAGLLAETQAMFAVQRDKYGVEQVIFHVPPGIALLRLHAPDKFGEQSKQPLILDVYASHVARHSVEIARSGPDLFAAVPVNGVDGKMIGSVEVGVNPGTVLDDIKRGYGLELGLYIEEEPLHRLATGIDPAVFDPQRRIGKHIQLHATDRALLTQLVDSSQLASATVPVRYTAMAAGVPYGVMLTPVPDSTGQIIGVLAAAQDFSSSRAAASRSKVWQVLVALFAIVLLSGLIIIVLRGGLLAPLRAISGRFDALARGDTARPGDDGPLCDELAALARHHERLRAEAEARSAPRGDA
ncbi:MAG: hypothetical protein K8W52_09035 [Deltaproteobacteria bacterium]|nr:hypothetical protein [Deltaproteobacteria bacterium]